MTLSPLRTRPLLFVLDDFLDEAAVARLLECVSPSALLARGVSFEHSPTGLTAEAPIAGEPALEDLAARLTSLIGAANEQGHTFRVRHAGPGDAHPPHLDEYDVGGAHLQITAHLYLTSVEGGATPFPNAEPPIAIEPLPGRLAVWFDTRPDGASDPASEHAIDAVFSGTRTGLTWFVYASHEALRTAAERARADESTTDGTTPLVAWWGRPEPDPLPTFRSTSRRARFNCLVEDRTPDTTRAALRRACESRDVKFVEIAAAALDPRRDPLPPGDLLYVPATSGAADRGERQLWQPGVVTFHRRSEGPFGVTLDPTLAFARAGLPVPRSVWITTTDRSTLKQLVEHVGGLPAIVRVDGGEGGVGVMRADTLPAFYALVDLLLQRSMLPRLVSYVPDAMHHRLIVVGERVVTSYLNPIKTEDFRSEPASTAADYGLTPTDEMAELAIAASHVVGSEFAGVDVIEHGPSGRLYLLEANFPCYFPQAEEFGKADVAGAMLDHLLAKADALRSR